MVNRKKYIASTIFKKYSLNTSRYKQRRDLSSCRDLSMWRHISTRSGKCLSITESNIPWCQPLCRGSASPRVGAGGGLASPGYKMISLGYKFQAETPAARSPPPLPSCYNPSPILFLVLSLSLVASHSLSGVLLHSFSFIFRLFPTFTSPTTSKTCLPRRKIYLPLGLNRINRIFR